MLVTEGYESPEVHVSIKRAITGGTGKTTGACNAPYHNFTRSLT
jgi:hypothetical protein